jgi:hypothetical protein
MVANPNAYVPDVYDFWFQEPELRYFATEKDCQTTGNEILKWARQTMEDKNKQVIKSWLDCIEVTKSEKASFNHQPRTAKSL